MLWSDPVATTEKSGQPSQVFAMSIAKYASGSGRKEIGSSTWFSQSMWKTSGGIRKMPPTAWRKRFTAPLSGSNMFRQTVATMIGGMTTGMMKRAR